MVDGADGPGQGASGNLAGVLRPLPSLDDNRLARITRAGALYALTSQYTNLAFFHWTVSTNAVMWTVIGGTGTLLGPFLGSGLVIVGTDLLSAQLPNFPLVVGLLVLGFVVFAPEGLLGLVARAFRAR